MIKFRPIPAYMIPNFIRTVSSHDWSEVYGAKDINENVSLFHQTLRNWLYIYFPEKEAKLSNLEN